MSTNNRIKVSDLDYNEIRENLKTFMRGQSQFSDYDFEGSALSTMIDLLAYNTHYNALYTNLAINEMFIDSASKRSSVVSIANNFGYTPQSCAASRTALQVTVTEQNATSLIKYIPKYSPFISSINGQQYTFYNLEDYAAEKNGDVYSFSDVMVYEGLVQTQLFLCSIIEQKFILPNSNIDLSTLSVTVQETGERPDYIKYEQAINVLDLTAESLVYYMKELDDGSYQLSFGTNNLGKPIAPGNIITITYLVTSKDAANGANQFTYAGPGVGGVVSAYTTSASFGGKDSESVAQIKKNVSQAFFDQNRAVTVGDYTSLIKRLYPNVDSINVWGGEDNEIPQYGKVFISVKPNSASFLTPPEKAYIVQTLLKSKNVVSVTPVVVDPSYLQMNMTTTVYYDASKTTRSAEEIRASVLDTIQSYRDVQLKKFNGVFRMSKFSSAIDASDQSILSSISTFKIYVEMEPRYNVASEYKLKIVNPIYQSGVPEESFMTTGFYIDNTDTIYYLDDDGAGKIRLYSVIAATGKKVIKNAAIGTIDYTNGSIHLKGLRITNLVDPNLYFIFKTASYDILSVRNQIVDIPLNRLTVNVIQDQTNNAGLVSGYNYTFTASR